MHNLLTTYAQVKFEKNKCYQKNHNKINSFTDLNSVWWKCYIMFACQFDNNLSALLLFEGFCHSYSKNEIISLRRATLAAGL
jgi:hypothetical protein